MRAAGKRITLRYGTDRAIVFCPLSDGQVEIVPAPASNRWLFEVHPFALIKRREQQQGIHANIGELIAGKPIFSGLGGDDGEVIGVLICHKPLVCFLAALQSKVVSQIILAILPNAILCVLAGFKVFQKRIVMEQRAVINPLPQLKIKDFWLYVNRSG